MQRARGLHAHAVRHAHNYRCAGGLRNGKRNANARGHGNGHSHGVGRTARITNANRNTNAHANSRGISTGRADTHAESRADTHTESRTDAHGESRTNTCSDGCTYGSRRTAGEQFQSFTVAVAVADRIDGKPYDHSSGATYRGLHRRILLHEPRRSDDILCARNGCHHGKQ
jgi:hypothetical protein